MTVIRALATAATIGALGLALGAGSAAAYSVTGGAYVGVAQAAHSGTVGGAYTFTCPGSTTTFTGVATGAATTNFTPSYGGVCTTFGLLTTVTQSGPWELTITGGGPTTFVGRIDIPAGTSTTISVPSAGCTTVTAGPQAFAGAVSVANVAGGIEVTGNVTGIAYSAFGCPFASGVSGQYRTNGYVFVPGVSVS